MRDCKGKSELTFSPDIFLTKVEHFAIAISTELHATLETLGER